MSEVFKKWAVSYSGCDGGDIGSPENRAIWVSGIEWGGGQTASDIEEYLLSDESRPPQGYDDWKINLKHRFNWQVMKLLSIVNGGHYSEYKQFAEKHRPFTRGSKGYFKLNLFPLAFKDTSHSLWTSDFAKVTGFETKSLYLEWCRENRHASIRLWCKAQRPKLVVCLGKTFESDFKKSFSDSECLVSKEVINGNEIAWLINEDGCLVVILPFMLNRNGLTKNADIQVVGERIAGLLQSRQA